MGMRGNRRGRYARVGAVIASMTLLAGVAACGGDDDDDDATSDSAAVTAAPADTAATTDAGDTATTAAGTEAPDATEGTTATERHRGHGAAEDSSASSGAPAGTAGCPEIDDSIDAEEGTGAGRFVSDLTCAGDAPLAAEGEPIVIGFQNPEGDPNGSFPEYSLAAQAAVDYINAELGGFGADVQNGVPGRPIELVTCKMAISPDDSQRCANELLAADPVPDRVQPQLLRQPDPDLPAGRRAGDRRDADHRR